MAIENIAIENIDQSSSSNKRGRKTTGTKSKSTVIPNPEADNVMDTTVDNRIDTDMDTTTDKLVSSVVDVDLETENNEDGSMKTKRRGRKPKDKFRYESTDIDEYQKNSRKDDNIIIKLPLSCLKLNEEFMVGKDLFPYNPNISTPKPAEPEDLLGRGIGFSMIENGDTNNQTGLQNHFETLPGSNLDNTIDNVIDGNLNGCGNTVDIGVGNGLNLDSQNKDIDKNIKNNQKHQTQHIQTHNKCNMCGCVGGNSVENKNGEQQQYNESRQIDIILNNKYNSNTDKFNVLTHLGMGINNSKWIEKTDVACLWCCHQFGNTPWGVPFKFANKMFQLFGNFCTANCTLAYILQNYKDDSMWEKVALLNLLHFKATGQYKNITPAFDKMALKMFGGTLEIEEYRNIINGNEKAYSIEFPPCNTIIPMLEEIYKKTNLNNTFIPVDKNRIQLANNELKLKRSKPVVNHKNTLDFCLGKVSA
jgi:thiol-disulfide isomerase/thioredoxin